MNCCIHRRYRIHCHTYTITLLDSELNKDNLGFFPWQLSFALVLVCWCFCLVPSQLLPFFFTTLSTCLLVYLSPCQHPSTCLPVCLSSCPTHVYTVTCLTVYISNCRIISLSTVYLSTCGLLSSLSICLLICFVPICCYSSCSPIVYMMLIHVLVLFRVIQEEALY